MAHSAHSHSTVHCLGGSVPSGAGPPRLPGPPCRPAPPDLLARWRSRCCWWRARLSGPDAAGTGGLIRHNTPAWLLTGRRACVSLLQCSSCQWCLCKQRRCSPGPPVSMPVAVSQTQPVAYSSCRHTNTAWKLPKTTPDCSLKDFREAITYFVGDTTSKQNLLSLSSHGLTEHSLRSSTTTVSESCSGTTES